MSPIGLADEREGLPILEAQEPLRVTAGQDGNLHPAAEAMWQRPHARECHESGDGYRFRRTHAIPTATAQTRTSAASPVRRGGQTAIVRARGAWRLLPAPADLARRYDAAASRWRAHMRYLGYPHAYAELFMQLRAEGWLSRLDGRTAVLDCGIGTAVLGAALARALPAVRWVAGVDVSPGMLARAAATLRAAGIAADLRRADARQLPFPDDSFDLVVTAHMLEHLDEPEVALQEMARVLRPGAPLVVIATRGGLADGMIRLKWRHVPLRRWDLARRIEIAGFHYVRTAPIGAPCRPAYWLSRAHLALKHGDGPAWPRPRTDAKANT